MGIYTGDIDATAYVEKYRKKPRGRGFWRFEFRVRPAGAAIEAKKVWSEPEGPPRAWGQLPYSGAANWARARARELNADRIRLVA